jgi:glycosyltransferase involved in cell wall biosynthesis
MGKVIFVSHEATRTGAPILLLNFMKWLRPSIAEEPLLILLSGGPLEQDFQKVSHIFKWSAVQPPAVSFLGGLKKKVRSQAHKLTRRRRLKEKVSLYNGDTLYMSTVACLRFYHDNHLLFKGKRSVLHCHEMPGNIARYVTPELESVYKGIDRIIVVNGIIRQYFIDKGIPENRILQVPEYIDVSDVTYAPAPHLGTLEIMGIGRGSERKGTDLFVDVAHAFGKKFSGDYVFTWVGFMPDEMKTRLQEEIARLGLNDRVRFAGEVSDSKKYLARADIFLLTSREDPYPLVMLEAALLAKPIIYFSGSGGADDFVNDAEVAAPPFDTEVMAEKIVALVSDRQKMEAKGIALKRKIPAHATEHVARQILEFINRSL